MYCFHHHQQLLLLYTDASTPGRREGAGEETSGEPYGGQKMSSDEEDATRRPQKGKNPRQSHLPLIQRASSKTLTLKKHSLVKATRLSWVPAPLCCDKVLKYQLGIKIDIWMISWSIWYITYHWIWGVEEPFCGHRQCPRHTIDHFWLIRINTTISNVTLCRTFLTMVDCWNKYLIR